MSPVTLPAASAKLIYREMTAGLVLLSPAPDSALAPEPDCPRRFLFVLIASRVWVIFKFGHNIP